MSPCPVISGLVLQALEHPFPGAARAVEGIAGDADRFTRDAGLCSRLQWALVSIPSPIGDFNGLSDNMNSLSGFFLRAE